MNTLQPDWKKMNGLLPAVVQHAETNAVLMVGYMNQEALTATVQKRRVTFFSRSRQCLWEKGETSGNTLNLQGISLDCDGDALLIKALPAGTVCHRGTATCFPDNFLFDLEQLVRNRRGTNQEESYTAKLFAKGRERIAKKVGEEGVEVALASLGSDEGHFLDECADLIFHLLVLLADRDCEFSQVVERLRSRQQPADLNPEITQSR